jgi:hypothetical protein
MRSPRVIAAVVVLMFGAFALLNMLGNPRLKGMRGPDILQVLAVGLCFGAGIALLAVAMQGRRDRLRSGRPEELEGDR